MIDPKNLAEFITAPDATEIMQAFSAMDQGPFRASLVAHLMTMSSMAAMTTNAAPAPVPALPEPEPVERPFISETVEGRILERKLRGESLRSIEKSEGVSFRFVRTVLEKAAREGGVDIGRMPAKTPAKAPTKKHTLSKEDRGLRRKEAIRLRKLGMGPKEIAVQLDMSIGNVGNAIWAAKTGAKGEPITVFPDIDETILAGSIPGPFNGGPRKRFVWAEHPEIEKEVIARFLRGDRAPALIAYIRDASGQDVTENMVLGRLYNRRPEFPVEVLREGPMSWMEAWTIMSVINRSPEGWLSKLADRLGLEARISPPQDINELAAPEKIALLRAAYHATIAAQGGNNENVAQTA